MIVKMKTLKTLCVALAVAAMLCAFAAPAAAQSRFSGAFDTYGAFYVGEKSGEYFGADGVIGVMTKGDYFWGVGLGYERRYLANEQYDPMSEFMNIDFPFFFGLPKTLKDNLFPLFLNMRHHWDVGRFKPSVDFRAGTSVCFSYGAGEYWFLSAGAGVRYELSDKTAAALRLYYKRSHSWYMDDMYQSELGLFNSLGLRLSYEF